MKKRTFYIILGIVAAICVALTVAHVIYAVNAYEHSSIITFIGGEIW